MRRIELSTDVDEQDDAGVMIAKLKGQLAREVPDPAEVAAFCKRLSGYTFASYKSNLDDPDRTPMPRGYRNVRIVDGRDGERIATIFWIGEGDVPNRQGLSHRVVTKRPDAQKVISILLCMIFQEVVSWRSTVAVPAESGMLDLVVDIETRPRTLLPHHGEPLPAGAVDWFTSQAPAKARRKDLG